MVESAEEELSTFPSLQLKFFLDRLQILPQIKTLKQFYSSTPQHPTIILGRINLDLIIESDQPL